MRKAKANLKSVGMGLEGYIKDRDSYNKKIEEAAKQFEECRQEVARLEKLVEEEKDNEQ